MKRMPFRKMLTQRQMKAKSLLCVGLDPLPEKMPEGIKACGQTWSELFFWMKEVIDATAPFASMFKFQRAHYEGWPDGQGRMALIGLIQHIHLSHPDIPVMIDAKRGDIKRTQECYRKALFGIDGADGVNFSPWMGSGCMKALIDEVKFPGRAIVGLGRTSNDDAWEIQDKIQPDGCFLWQHVVEKMRDWAELFGIIENAGLVMGAAHKASLLNQYDFYPRKYGKDEIYAEHLSLCREIVGNKMWLLIPGIDKQGGFIKETVEKACVGPGSISINSSSGICLASTGDDFREAAAGKAEETRDEINLYL